MREINKAKSDQAGRPLRDDALDAVTGGIGAVIGSNSTEGNEEASGAQSIRHYTIGFSAPY